MNVVMGRFSNAAMLCAAFAFIPLAAGCPGDDGDPVEPEAGPEAEPEISTEVAPVGTAQFLCEIQYRGYLNQLSFISAAFNGGTCVDFLSDEERDAIYGETPWFADQAEFANSIRSECGANPDLLARNTEIIERGNVAFDDAAITACRDAGLELRMLYTGPVLYGLDESVDPDDIGADFEADFERCTAAITGTLGEGDDCVSDLECEGNTYCQLNLSTKTPQCLPLAQSGEACSSSGPRSCAAPLVCHRDTCTNRGGLGSPCGDDDPACGQDFYCQDNPDTETSNCVARGGEGGICDYSDSECEEGLECHNYYDEGLQDSVGFCKTPGTEGDDCANNGPCETGLYCDVDNTDVCSPPFALGQTCPSLNSCADNCTVCRLESADGEVKKCLAYGTAGDACDSQSQCAPGLYCETSTNGCRAEKADGAVCDSYYECRSDECNYENDDDETRVCQPEIESEAVGCGAAGEDRCAAGEACSGGLCIDGYFCADPDPEDTEGSVCVPVPNDGDPCIGGTACDGLTQYCDTEPENPICEAKRAVGATCDDTDQCVTASCYTADGAEIGECVPSAGGCFDSKAAMAQFLFYSLLWLPIRRLRRRRRERLQ